MGLFSWQDLLEGESQLLPCLPTFAALDEDRPQVVAEPASVGVDRWKVLWHNPTSSAQQVTYTVCAVCAAVQ